MTNNNHESAARTADQAALGLALCVARTTARIPLLLVPAPAGFPSPADDYAEAPIDFNELLIEDAAATFVARIRGDSMEGAGLFDGDLVVVNRARTPVSGSIVLAILDDEFVLKRLVRSGDRAILRAENPDYADIVVSPERRFEVWGVVVRSIRTF
jgi:DNA polymerase V